MSSAIHPIHMKQHTGYILRDACATLTLPCDGGFLGSCHRPIVVGHSSSIKSRNVTARISYPIHSGHEALHIMAPSNEIPTGSSEISFAGSPSYGDRSSTTTAAAASNSIADRWREYHGCKQWQGLLEPLDQALREEIIRYGDLAQLTYDAFDCERKCCIYEEAELLQLHARLPNRGYKVTKYIYAAPEVHLLPEWLRKWRHKEENHKDGRGCWVGFIAVMEDEEEIRRIGRRDVVVAWRGTVTKQEWLEDMDGALVELPEYGNGVVGPDVHNCDVPLDHVGVERGFWNLYASGEHSAREQVTDEIRRLISIYGGGGGGGGGGSDPLHELSITMTGHSLGGALALVSAYDLASLGLNSSSTAPISVISFAAPRVGNAAFKRRLHDELKVNVLRVVNAHDIVPKVPGILSHENDRASAPPDDAAVHVSGGEPSWHKILDTLLHVAHSSYIHVGVALHLDNRHSPFLKPSASLADAHNLEVYLHLLDAYRSTQEPFVDQRRSNHGVHYIGHANNLHSLSDRLLHFYVDFLNRNLALVNKSSNLLLDDLQIPPHWWTTFLTSKNSTR